MKQSTIEPSVNENAAAGFLLDSFSAGGFCSDTERKKLEQRYAPLLTVTDRFNRQNVSYQSNKNHILHNWLKYKEGFSANLVNTLLDEMDLNQGDWVMDPFMGSGTTALVCQMRGINSIGYDIMPISTVSMAAKSAVFQYDLQELQAMIHAIESMTLPPDHTGCTPYITITQDAYPEKNEKFLHYIAQWQKTARYSPPAKNLLTLCIINSLEPCSYTTKSGQYLSWDARSKKVIQANARRADKGRKPLTAKCVRRTIADAKETILAELHRVTEEIALIQCAGGSPTAEIRFTQSSALYELPKLPECCLSGVITSPPYCNRYDYTRTYALELAYLGVDDGHIKKMRQSLLSCTVENKPKLEALKEFYGSIGQTARFEAIRTAIQANTAFQEIMTALQQRKDHGDLNNDGVIRMVEGYFSELAFLYAELYRTCKPGAAVAFVNDNVRYGGEVIPVDFLCSSFAEQFGFQVDTIYTLKQKKGNSSQQMAKFGRVALRKSITVWRKA